MNVVLKNVSIEHGECLLEARLGDECVAEDFESAECICDLNFPLAILYIECLVKLQKLILLNPRISYIQR